MSKTLIKNAKIYDGSGAPAFLGDVLIEGERILQIGESLPVEADAEVLDLEGLSLAPGFIDAHSHNDWFALRKEPLNYFAPFIKQGITTFCLETRAVFTVTIVRWLMPDASFCQQATMSRLPTL